MVTIYTLNGISVYKRYLEEQDIFEYRIFEDDEYGHAMRFPSDKPMGETMDAIWKYIQELVQKPLFNINTTVTAK